MSRPVMPPALQRLPSGAYPDMPEPIAADVLFRGRQEVLIRHQGEIYRLRITRNGKLILNK